MYSEQIPGWFDYQGLYDAVVYNIPQNGIFVEIGVWYGKSICYLAELAKQNNKNIKIYGIDHFNCKMPGYEEPFPPINKKIVIDKNSRFQETLEHFHNAQVFDMITLLPLYSEDAVKFFNDESVHFVFIDANHKYEYVKQDLELWYPKLQTGAYFAGHDYNTRDGVKKAADEFAEAKKIKLRSEINGRCFLAQKLPAVV